jgi:V8-like Glu-specific endopeptidase
MNNFQTIFKIFTIIILFQVFSLEARDKILYQDSINSSLYQADDRANISSYPDEIFKSYALSVAGMVAKKKIQPRFRKQNRPYFFNKTFVQEKKYYDSRSKAFLPICPNENKFENEFVLPTCTGFYIGNNLLITAAHCVKKEFSCEDFVWIFGMTLEEMEDERIEGKNIYNCDQILTQSYKRKDFVETDFAIISLKQKVASHILPLKYRTSGKIKANTEVVMIGHPQGLPLKITDNAFVSRFNTKEMISPLKAIKRRKRLFLTTLDSFSGNSGSPVFNKETKLLEGMFFAGKRDYTLDSHKQCFKFKKKKNNSLSSREKVLRITKIPFLTRQSKAP